MSRKKNEITAKIVSDAMDFAVKAAKIIEKDSRYDIEAYGFIMAALHYKLSGLKEHRHISGKELLEGIREYGLGQYGPMTRTVFEYWGIKDTADFGEIVFNLVEVELMKRSPEDTKEQFKDVYDFESAFDKPYRKTTTPRIARRKRSKKE